MVLNVNCMLSVNFTLNRPPQCEQRHSGILLHLSPRCEQSGGVTFITASATFMMRTTTIRSCKYYQCSYSQCEHRHLKLLSLIRMCTFISTVITPNTSLRVQYFISKPNHDYMSGEAITRLASTIWFLCVFLTHQSRVTLSTN